MIVWALVAMLGDGSVAVKDEVALDRARIQRHLAGVEAELRAADTVELSPAQRVERAKNLDRLHAYWTAGVFPHNTDFVGARVPYFIDEDDRACAVGHLMIASGADDLAAQIRRDENNAKLLDMRTPGLLAWVARSGLTAKEHARIQPAYCDCPDDEMPVCGTDGHTYLNACYAMTCSGVEVAHDGACEGEPTTGWPEPGTSSGDSGSSSDTSTGGDPITVGEESSGDHDDDKGCNVGGSSPFAMLVLFAAMRRRRR